MNKASPLRLVAAGYLLALLVAVVVVGLHVVVADGPERQAGSGMSAFGDALLFVAIFGLASLPATIAALFLLRSRRTFWRLASVLAPAIAATAIAAAADSLLPASPGTGALAAASSPLSPLRILLAPFCAAAFALAGLIAPAFAFRVALLVAAAIETLVFASVALIGWQAFR